MVVLVARVAAVGCSWAMAATVGLVRSRSLPVLRAVPVGLAAIPGSCRCWERVVSVVPVGRAMPGSVAVTEVPVALADVPESSTVAAVPVVRVAPAAMTAMVVTVVPVAPRVRSHWWARAVPVVPVATAATTATVAPVVQAAVRV
jgi:hypothetical protein